MLTSKKFKFTESEIVKLCEAGGLAPSGGNAQPWKVTINSNILTLQVNTKRLTGFLDIGKYASFFALGCFMENLCIQADALGLIYTYEILENKNKDDVIIKMIFTNRTGLLKKSELTVLEPYIKKRATNRKIYDGTMVSANVIRQLQKVVAEYMPDVFDFREVSNPDEKKKIAKILGKADGVRIMHDKPFKDMMEEIRWSDDEVEQTRDGMDIKTLELPANMDKMLRLLKKMPYMRRFMPISAFEKMAEPVLLNCSHLCCLFMSSELSPSRIVLAGRLVERLWLTVTKFDVSFQPWASFPFFVIRNNYFKGEGFNNEQKDIIQETENKLLEAFGIQNRALPAFIFRLSNSKPPSARALRIYWKEFTEIKN